MLISFAGFKTAGKDAAASVLINEYGFTKVALADPVRDFAYAINPVVEIRMDYNLFGKVQGYECIRLQELIDEFGWDHCKNTYPEVRRLMQAVGTEGGRTLFGEDFWIDQLKKSYPFLYDPDDYYVLTDARFFNEGRFVQKTGGTLIWIDRPGLVSDGHASESGELRGIADHILVNDSTIEELQEDVRLFAFMNDISRN